MKIEINFNPVAVASILIIEDEKIILENLNDLLEIFGYDCFTANNGVDGLMLGQNKLPDLIICDISLPGLNGFQVKAELNKSKETALIPFIYLTARAEKSSKTEGLALGANAYIIKPFKINELVEIVEKYIQHIH